MEAAYINHEFTSQLSFDDVAKIFFKNNSTESVKVAFWQIFQCWMKKGCKIRTEISDEEIALFFDQLIDLVAAAYILHQANRVSESGQERAGND